MQRGRNPIVALAAALLLLSAAPAVAGSNLTGNDLLERCSASASDNPIQWGVCLGYVMAVADLLGQGRPINGARACIAADVTSGQLMDIVRQWLQRNPARRHLNGAALVAVALQQAFPCK
jgi:hypothetical protein